MTSQVVSIAVTGDMPLGDLKALCEALKAKLRAEPEISLVSVDGFSERQIRVEFSAETLAKLGLGVSDAASAIAAQSLDLPAGAVEALDGEVLVRFADQRRTPLELAGVVLAASANGAQVLLGDAASRIVDRFELEEEKFLFNGERAGLIRVEKNKQDDAVRVLRAVEAFIAREAPALPPGVELRLTEDNTTLVMDRIELLAVNGVEGFILVFLTLWLFFSFRLSFWVAMGLPASFLGAFFFFPLIGYSINMITLVGLLIALGLLMDDAIVIAENVATHMAEGKSAMAAAIEGVDEVKAGVFSSFLTTVCVFCPLAFLTGDIGKVLRVMPVVLIIVLAVSLIEAFLILPNHLGHSLGREKAPGRFRQRFDGFIEWFREKVLGRSVDWVVSWRYLSVGLMVALFLASVGMMAGGRLKFSSFPDIDGDILVARLLMAEGTPLARTEAVVEEIVDALDRVNAEFKPRQPDGQDLVKSVSVRFNRNTDARESGPHVATVSVDLLSAEIRDAKLDDVVNRWREATGAIPDVATLQFAQPNEGPAGRAIEVELYGDDMGELESAAALLTERFASYKGAFDVSNDLRRGKVEARVRLRDGAASLGINAASVASQLQAAFQGRAAGEVQVGTESYEIEVKLAADDRDTLDALETFRVAMPGGEFSPLSQVALIEYSRGYTRLVRVDGRRTVTIQGDVDARQSNTMQILGEVEREFLPGLLAEHPGVSYRFKGEAAKSAETGSSMSNALRIGLIGIFLLLSFQFRSYIEPVIVMAAIPLALMGVVWGHLLMGLDLTMPSMAGFVSLAGVVVNDSILLVEFVKMRRREGLSATEAARAASRARFRAVLLTSMTTIVGLLPLLFERSPQAQVLIPLAASIVFGLMASTLLVLLIIPALYGMLDDFGLASKVEEE
jgi:HAE1 family hydrophobic/amphiphilic exporter-1